MKPRPPGRRSARLCGDSVNGHGHDDGADLVQREATPHPSAKAQTQGQRQGKSVITIALVRWHGRTLPLTHSKEIVTVQCSATDNGHHGGAGSVSYCLADNQRM